MRTLHISPSLCCFPTYNIRVDIENIDLQKHARSKWSIAARIEKSETRQW